MIKKALAFLLLSASLRSPLPLTRAACWVSAPVKPARAGRWWRGSMTAKPCGGIRPAWTSAGTLTQGSIAWPGPGRVLVVTPPCGSPWLDLEPLALGYGIGYRHVGFQAGADEQEISLGVAFFSFHRGRAPADGLRPALSLQERLGVADIHAGGYGLDLGFSYKPRLWRATR